MAFKISEILGHNLSPSQVNTYAWCPEQWRIHYLNKLRQRKSWQKTSGSIFHKLFEMASRNYSDKYIGPHMEDLIVETCLHYVPDAIWKIFYKPIIQMFATYERKRYDILLNFTGDQDLATKYWIPIHNERKMELDGMTFIADRELLVPDGFYGQKGEAREIVDFKPKGTHGMKPDLNRQLAIMAVYLSAPANNVQVDRTLPFVGAYYYRSGFAPATKKVHHSTTAALLKLLKNMLLSLKKSEFLKNFGYKCHKCDYRIVCRDRIPLIQKLEIGRSKDKLYGGIFDAIPRHKNKLI